LTASKPVRNMRPCVEAARLQRKASKTKRMKIPKVEKPKVSMRGGAAW